MAKIVASRKRMYSVMNNGGFGDLIMYQKGLKIVVPSNYITKQGIVYKRINKLLVEQNFERLRELGVAVM